MSAVVNENACTGCGVCFTICPSDVFVMNEANGLAKAKYPMDCTDCRLCERNCSFYAIRIAAPSKRSSRPFTFSLYLEGLGIK